MHRISFASKIFRTLSNEENFERGHEEFDNQNTIPYTLEYKIIIFLACHLKKNHMRISFFLFSFFLKTQELRLIVLEEENGAHTTH